MFRLTKRILKSFYLSPSSRFSSTSAQSSEQPTTPFGSTVYIEQMYNLWLQDPAKVHSSWHDYFKEIQAEELIEKAQASHIAEQARDLSPAELEKLRSDVIKIYFYVRSFNKRGHELANLDPLSNFLIFTKVKRGFCRYGQSHAGTVRSEEQAKSRARLSVLWVHRSRPR